MAAVDQTGHAATLTMATSNFDNSGGMSSLAINIISIGGFTSSREKIDTSHLGTTTYRTSQPGDLIDPGEFTVEFFYDADEQPPISAAAETVTVTYNTGENITGSAFVTEWTAPDAATDQMLIGNMTIAWAGTPTFNDS